MINLPLVMVIVDGEGYLVCMLGEEVDWVRNVKARLATSLYAWSSRGGPS